MMGAYGLLDDGPDSSSTAFASFTSSPPSDPPPTRFHPYQQVKRKARKIRLPTMADYRKKIAKRRMLMDNPTCAHISNIRTSSISRSPTCTSIPKFRELSEEQSDCPQFISRLTNSGTENIPPTSAQPVKGNRSVSIRPSSTSTIKFDPELNKEQGDIVDGALRPHPGSEVLVEGFKLSITRKDVATMAGRNWLNDMAINIYMNLLMKRGRGANMPSLHAFNTFFYPTVMSAGHQGVRRWSKKVDIFSMDYMLIPVHLAKHWCLGVIDLRNEEIRYLYDSMGGDNDNCLNALQQYLEDESMDKRGRHFDTSGFKLTNVKSIPRQRNHRDCGVFTCTIAEYVTLNTEITFTHAHALLQATKGI